jgi:hypothetical protein
VLNLKVLEGKEVVRFKDLADVFVKYDSVCVFVTRK